MTSALVERLMRNAAGSGRKQLLLAIVGGTLPALLVVGALTAAGLQAQAPTQVAPCRNGRKTRAAKWRSTWYRSR